MKKTNIKLNSQIGCKTIWDRWSRPDIPNCTDYWSQFRFRSKLHSKHIWNNTSLFRHFDKEYRDRIHSSDLAKISNSTKCRKPCFYKKYSLVGEEQPSQIDNGQLLFSMVAMQDSIEVQLGQWIKIMSHKTHQECLPSSHVSHEIEDQLSQETF